MGFHLMQYRLTIKKVSNETGICYEKLGFIFLH